MSPQTACRAELRVEYGVRCGMRTYGNGVCKGRVGNSNSMAKQYKTSTYTIRRAINTEIV
jgi:hypothetical protein